MPKVLVVEDRDGCFTMIKSKLKLNGPIEVLRAVTLKEAADFFQSNPDIDLIIIDACVQSEFPNTMPLVKKIITSGYIKPIIACSSVLFYREELINAGATHQANKFDAAEMALKLLGL